MYDKNKEGKMEFVLRFPVNGCPYISCLIKGEAEKEFGKWKGTVQVSFSCQEQGDYYPDNPAEHYARKWGGKYKLSELPEELITLAKQELKPGCYQNFYRSASKLAIQWLRNMEGPFIPSEKFDEVRDALIEHLKTSHDSYKLFDLAVMAGII
jgi:hypothetical protein